MRPHGPQESYFDSTQQMKIKGLFTNNAVEMISNHYGLSQNKTCVLETSTEEKS